MRLFFALWPPPAAAHALATWAQAVHRDTGGRVTAEESIHLTLAFLGDADPAKAAAAARRVKGRAFVLPLDTSKYWKHNQIVWAGPNAMPPPLSDLATQLHRALSDHGFILEKRPFAAHITLLRKTSPPTALPPLPPIHWPAPEFVLVRSVPGNKGSRYETVERFPIGVGRLDKA